jgi:hypothetical protein
VSPLVAVGSFVREGRPVLHRVASGIACGALAALAAAVVAAPASAATCNRRQTQPFVPWFDQAFYVLTPGGAIEPGSNTWRLARGAAIVSGNEPFHVHASSDGNSLSLPSGSWAMTKKVCLELTDPTIRFFVVNNGSPTAALNVVAYFRDGVGALLGKAPVATLLGTPDWAPTLPIAVLGNGAAPTGTKYVQFRFEPVGSNSGWRIDDVYVDPWFSKI